MYDLYLFTLWNSIKIVVFVYLWYLSFSGSDVIDNGPVSPALSEQPVTGERQLNHSESEGVCVNCLSSFNKLQTRFPKEPGVGGLFVVQG